MRKYNLDKKLDNFAHTIDLFLVNHESSIEDIHILRKTARELLSLVDTSDPFYPQLKKIIKLSNTIRDIDVFLEIFIRSLKPTFKKSLDLYTLTINSQKTREKSSSKLYSHLEHLNIPSNLQSKKITDTLSLKKLKRKKPLVFEQKPLHKYRIDIKHTLYALKKNQKLKKTQKKTLIELKALLGKINDNFNAIKRLKKTPLVEKKLLKKIEKYTLEKNMRYFHKVQKLSDRL